MVAPRTGGFAAGIVLSDPTAGPRRDDGTRSESVISGSTAAAVDLSRAWLPCQEQAGGGAAGTLAISKFKSSIFVLSRPAPEAMMATQNFDGEGTQCFLGYASV